MRLPGPRWWLRVVGEVLRRPWLWGTAVVVTLRLARPGWWRRAPFLPLPDPDYLHFRLETQYGGAGTGDPDPADLVAYLSWCHETKTR